MANELNKNTGMNNEDLERKLITAQIKIDELTKQLNESDSSSLKVVQLERENIQLRARLAELERELDNLQSSGDDAASKEAIAEVMLEAQRKAREITDNANYEVKEARKLLSHAEYELELVTRDARNYYRQVEDARAEADRLFNEMLKNLGTLKEIKHVKSEREDVVEEF